MPGKGNDDSIYTTWNITHLSYTAYNPEMFWETVGIKKLGLPVPPLFDSNYARAIAICTIQEINRKWPEPDEGKSTYQRDVLNETVNDISKYYESCSKVFFKKFPEKPVTKDERERLHRYIRGIARLRIESAPRPLYGEKRKDADNRVYLVDSENDRSQEDMIDTALNYGYVLGRDELSDLDRHIISTSLDEATITDESTDIISKYFLQNRPQVQSIVPYFQNKVLVGLIPQTLWTEVRVFEWKAAEVYSLLEDIDMGVPIAQNGKSYLYMFYLMVCIAALQQKWKTSVQAVSESSMIIGRQHIPTLTTLVIKTFLHYTKDLEMNVFSHIEFPPPMTPNDVKEFGNLIKDKPRNLLKSINVPLTSIHKSSKKVKTTKLMAAISDDVLPETFNLEEAFESYEVFEALTNNIVASFLEGKIIDEPDSGKVQEPILLVRLKSISGDASEKAILEAVRGPWSVTRQRLEKVEYIIPLVSGIAQDVCKLDDIKSGPKPGQWACSCSIADEDVRTKYKGVDFSDQFPKGSANPVKYLNV